MKGREKMDELLVQIDTNNHSIQTNFDKIKAELEEKLNDYKGIIVDEVTIKESKKDLADLRKMSGEVDTVRKQIKAEWEKPYEEFKAKCDELTGLIDVPIAEIKKQLDEFEAKRKAEKEIHIKELYAENIGEYGDYLTYKVIFNPKWLNASYSDKDVKYDLSEAVTKVRSDIDAIKALGSEIEEECLKAYKDSGNNLASAIKRNSDYLSAKQLAEKKVEEEKISKEEAVKEEAVDEPFMNLPVEDKPNNSFTFRVEGDENIQKVKEFLEFAEIKYQEV